MGLLRQQFSRKLKGKLRRLFRIWRNQAPPHFQAIRVSHMQAQKRYRANYYAQPVFLIQSGHNGRDTRIVNLWRSLVHGRFSEQIIPNSKHIDVVGRDGRSVKDVAHLIQAYLYV